MDESQPELANEAEKEEVLDPGCWLSRLSP